MLQSDLSTLFEHLPIGAYRFTLDGKVLRMNAALLRLNGFNTEQELREACGDCAPDPYLLPGRREEFKSMLVDQGSVQNFESEIVRYTTGERMWVREHAQLVRDHNGDPQYYEGTVEDITEQHQVHAKLLRDTTEELELAIMGADLGRWDHDLRLETGYRMDERACSLLGREPQESNRARAWGHLVHPDDLPTTLHAMQAHLSGATAAFQAEYRARHADGRWIWLSSRGKVVKTSPEGHPIRMVGTVMDVSNRKHAEIQLRATQSELEATLNALPDLLVEYNAEGRCRAMHSHGVEDLVSPASFQVGKLITEVLPKEAAEVCITALQEARDTGRSMGRHYSLQLLRGKQWFELSVVRKPTDPGDEDRFIAIVRNITERKDTESAIAHLAFHDALTGLPNRRLLTDRLQSAVLQSQRSQKHGAVLFLDLDKFKQLNDTRGHDTGDLLLQEVGARLLQSVRAVDTVARLGGDEFVVLLHDLSAHAPEARLHVSTVAHKILAGLNEPYALKGMHHNVTPSIGIALFKGNETPPETLLKQADTAMYKAKEDGRNTLRFYEPQ